MWNTWFGTGGEEVEVEVKKTEVQKNLEKAKENIAKRETTVDVYMRIKDDNDMKDAVYEDWKIGFKEMKSKVKIAYRKAGEDIVCGQLMEGRTGKKLEKFEIYRLKQMIPDECIDITIHGCKNWNDFWNRTFVKQFKESLEDVCNIQDNCTIRAKKEMLKKLNADVHFFAEISKKVEGLIEKYSKENKVPPSKDVILPEIEDAFEQRKNTKESGEDVKEEQNLVEDEEKEKEENSVKDEEKEKE